MPEDSIDRNPWMEEIKLKNQRNALNGLYAAPEVVQSIYKIYRPADEIMESNEDAYKKVQDYWKHLGRRNAFQRASNYVNMATLIANPGSTFRNMYGTAAQLLHTGAIPIKGIKEISSLVKEWSQMRLLYRKAQEGGIGAEASAQKLLQAEEKL